jgi:hypothetical protein
MIEPFCIAVPQEDLDNLHAKLEEINTAKKLVRRAPTASEVEKWVAEAKTLPAKITH